MVRVDEMVARAKTAYRSGRSAEARDLLLDVVQHDPSHQDAWLWLSGLVDTLDYQRECLENVLALNPMHERARKGLAAVEQQIAARGAERDAPPEKEPPPKPEWDAPATSVEWGRDDGAAVYGSGKHVELPTHEDYDAWVSELHLGAEESSPPQTPPFFAEAPTSPFGDTSYMFDPEPFFGDSPLAPRSDDHAPNDLWAGTSASAREPEPVMAPEPDNELDESGRVWPAPQPLAEPDSPSARQPARHEFSFDEGDDGDVPALTPKEPAVSEPVAPTVSAPEPAPAPPRPAQPTAPGPEGYFAYIPAEITADAAKRRSRALTVALVIFILADAAAAAALVSAL